MLRIDPSLHVPGAKIPEEFVRIADVYALTMEWWDGYQITWQQQRHSGRLHLRLPGLLWKAECSTSYFVLRTSFLTKFARSSAEDRQSFVAGIIRLAANIKHFDVCKGLHPMSFPSHELPNPPTVLRTDYSRTVLCGMIQAFGLYEQGTHPTRNEGGLDRCSRLKVAPL